MTYSNSKTVMAAYLREFWKVSTISLIGNDAGSHELSDLPITRSTSMISKKIMRWQARTDAGEESPKFEFHLQSLSSDSTNLDVNSGPSLEEQVYALQALKESFRFAMDCERNVWEFAIEIDELNDLGVSRSLLRWLVCQKLIEHRLESRVNKESRRQFFEAPNLVFHNHSCFILSTKGHQAFAELSKRYRPMISHTHPDPDLLPMNAPPRETPSWCPETRVLKIAGKVVKHFKWPAPNQEMLIAAFAELNWPEQIDDPLPQTDVCRKRRLHDTIKCLNRNQIHPLIKFRGDGTGFAARWEFRPAKTSK